ncbi:hypothetical protein PG984_014941 [Apiospora sp. TS-2023a]
MGTEENTEKSGETGPDKKVEVPNMPTSKAQHGSMESPVDVFNLARTCRDQWKLLETEIYRTDVLFHKKYLDKSEFTKEKGWHAIMEEKSYDSDDAEDSEWGLEHYEMTWLRPLSDPKWRPLTALQWAAVAGEEGVAEKTITVAGRIWPGYVFLKHLDSLNSPVHFAAWYGNTGILRLLSQVKHGGLMPDMNVVSGATWLARNISGDDHQVRDIFRYINPSIVQFPEEVFAHSMRKDFGLDAADIAILRGHVGTAEYLISNFYDNDRTVETAETARIANDEDHEDTEFEWAVHPLHLACFMGMEKVVTAILKKGADVNTASTQLEYTTPLMWAVARPNNDAVIECLLGHGADVGLGDDVKRDALLWAVLFHAHENALRLIEMGARADHDFSTNQIVYDYHPYRECALGLCMEDDAFLPCTQLILQTNPDFPEGLLRNCMYHALCDVSKNQETIRWLIKRGIGLGPLQEGELRGDDRGENRNTGEVGMSALHYIAGSGVLPLDLLAAVLEKRPQDINRASKEQGNTPLSMALKLGFHSEKVAFLLANGADPAACRLQNDRVILMAVKKGIRPSVIQKLQASLNARTKIERCKASWKFWQSRYPNGKTYTAKQIKQLQKQGVHFRTAEGGIRLGLSIDEMIQLPSRGTSVEDEFGRLIQKNDDEKERELEQFKKRANRKRERRRRKSLRRHRLGMYHIPDRSHRFDFYLQHPE